jgi:HK97 gp10 family phage protein
MEIKIDGLSELSEMLTQESVRTAKRYLLNVAKPAAEVVIDAMDATAPVETGRLEGGIDYKTRFSGGGEGTTLTVNIGPDKETFWGSFQEFGSFDQPAQHWMACAWEACQDKCLSVFEDGAREQIAKMKAKK